MRIHKQIHISLTSSLTSGFNSRRMSLLTIREDIFDSSLSFLSCLLYKSLFFPHLCWFWSGLCSWFGRPYFILSIWWFWLTRAFTYYSAILWPTVHLTPIAVTIKEISWVEQMLLYFSCDIPPQLLQHVKQGGSFWNAVHVWNYDRILKLMG